MNWKVCERKQSKPVLEYYPTICLERLRKTTTHRTASIQVEIWTQTSGIRNRNANYWVVTFGGKSFVLVCAPLYEIIINMSSTVWCVHMMSHCTAGTEYGQTAGFCWHDNEYSGSVKSEHILTSCETTNLFYSPLAYYYYFYSSSPLSQSPPPSSFPSRFLFSSLLFCIFSCYSFSCCAFFFNVVTR